MSLVYYGFLARYINLLVFKNKTLGRTLEKQSAKRGSDTLLLFENEKLSFQDFNAQVNRRAHFFQSKGVRKGEVVLLIMENRPEYLATVCGLAKLGAVTAAINYNLVGNALTNLLNSSAATRIVVGGECLSQFMDVMQSLEKITPNNVYLDVRWEPEAAPHPAFVNLTQEIHRHKAVNPPDPGLTSLDPFMHIYTSGTTGLPKPASINHYRWYGAGLVMGYYGLRVTPKDTLLCPLPLYHSNGILIAFSSALVNGARFAIIRRFSATNFWGDAIKLGATTFIYIGELLRYLVNNPPGKYDRKHRITRILGNGLRPDIWSKFRFRFNIRDIREFYASTEGNAYTLNLNNVEGSVGTTILKTSDNLKVVRYSIEKDDYIRDSAGFLQKCAPEEVGELLAEIKGLTPFHGYAHKADTEKKILRNGLKKGDAFFKTGDLVKKDKQGNYFFIDRIGDTYRWKGENVSTHEVEEIITAGIPWITFSAVYGVEVPGTEGRVGMAAITLEPAFEFRPDALFQYMEEHLPAYARPLFIRVQKEMDVTGTFKKDKKVLKSEGYNPTRVSDPLYYMDRESKTYVALDSAGMKKITSGWLKV